MRVRENDGAECVRMRHDVLKVRDDEIYAEHLVVGELHAGVNEDKGAFEFKEGRVFADLIHPAQRSDAQRRLSQSHLLSYQMHWPKSKGRLFLASRGYL